VVNKDLKGKAPAWQVLQLVRLLSLAGDADKAKELSEPLKGDVKSRAQLEMMRGQLARSATAAPLNLPDEVAEKDTPAHTLAWLALARHNARNGSTVTGDEVGETLRPLINLSVDLGKKDR
jgi:hypothetical protein